MASVDLTEAYLDVPIHPSHRQFLRFCYVGRHFQYAALQFGLALALQAFTKIMTALATYLRALPIRIQCYLDDLLIQVSWPQVEKKSKHDNPDPLGSRVLSQPGQMSFDTHDKAGALGGTHRHGNWTSLSLPGAPGQHQGLDSQIRADRIVQLELLSQLLGKMIPCITIVPWARFHARPLQWFLLPYQRAGRCTSTARV